ncbi:MAG TPA: surface carbohydrate biosynthesis protein, partial [Dongiaceae bacterium]
MNARLRPILYMPMEIASRELDSRLLLATLAVARGYEVVLGQKWLIEQNIHAMPPGLYLSKTLTQRDGIAMADARSRGYVVAAIDEELPGLFMSAQQLRWMSSDAVDATDMIFVAGAGNSAAIAERFPTAANKIVQAANPRWDMLRPNLRDYYAAEVADLKRRYGRFILINTNFGFTNSEKGDAGQIVREQERLGKLDMKNLEHVDYVKSIITMETENRQAIEQLLIALPIRFPEHRIVVRPHPSESADTWQKIVAGRQGIDVIREGAAVAWILASDVLIHTNCTTGVEALALDKSAICLVPSMSSANDR